MPRTDGVSSNSRTWFILRRPRPLSVALCFGKRPIALLVCLTLIVAMSAYPKISSTGKPRFAATCAGEFIAVSASIVARTTLIGFVEP